MDKVTELLDYVKYAVGGKVYLVGGAVRDEIMGREITDWDFSTPLTPDEVEANVRAAGRRAYTTGKRFGTIGFKTPDGENMVEVTTFRYEKYDRESRKPVVEFGKDLTADLARRDFTMNAIAAIDHKLIDPFDGMGDIMCRRIRAVGNPTLRFKDDPLRMLRACRFASQLGFDIEDATLKSIKKNASLILKVANERILVELNKLLEGGFVGIGLSYLEQSGLLRYILPELQVQVGYDQRSKYHTLTLWEHTKRVVEGMPSDAVMGWAALLHDVGKPAAAIDKGDRTIYPQHERIGTVMAQSICERFRMSKVDTGFIVTAVRYHLHDGAPTKESDDAAK